MKIVISVLGHVVLPGGSEMKMAISILGKCRVARCVCEMKMVISVLGHVVLPGVSVR